VVHRFFKDTPPDLHRGEIAPSYFANAIAARTNSKAHSKLQNQFARFAILQHACIRSIDFSEEGRKRVQRSENFTEYWQSLVHWGSDLCSYATQIRRWQDAFGVRSCVGDVLRRSDDGSTRLPEPVLRFRRAHRAWRWKKSPVTDVKVLSVWSGARSNSNLQAGR